MESRKKEDSAKSSTLSSSYHGVLIYAEHRHGRTHPVTYELLGKGRELADQLHEPLCAVILGHDLSKASKALVERGADRAYVFDDPMLTEFRDDPYAALLADLVRDVRPAIFLIGATAVGRSLGPKIAARLGTGLTADCTELSVDQKTRLLVQVRPAYGGNIMATIVCPDKRPQMATVRYKVMTEAQPQLGRNGEIVMKHVPKDGLFDRVKILEFEPAVEEVSIIDANLVVSGGKGLGEPSGFKIVEELAQELGGAVGASRLTVDEGWINYTHQVGLSGRTVRPSVYIACGISGAVQHLAGMKTSETVIAINKDPEAPIFKASSLGVVGDLHEVIPKLIEKIRAYKASRNV